MRLPRHEVAEERPREGAALQKLAHVHEVRGCLADEAGVLVELVDNLANELAELRTERGQNEDRRKTK